LILAKHAVSGPFATTRKRLLKAVLMTMMLVSVAAGVAGALHGVRISLDMLLGAAVVLLPSGWVAVSLTSERSVLSPIWLGLARYSLATLGFAALFTVRPGSDPVAVLAGSAIALFLPSVMMAKTSGRAGTAAENTK